MRFLISLGLLVCLCSCRTVPREDTQTRSLQHYDFGDLDALQAEEARPVFVFFQADWCRYCKAMEQTTFRQPDIIQDLNERFYFVSFNGESQSPVSFGGRTYHFRPTGRRTGTHDLASHLGRIDGKLIYPILVILDQRYEIQFRYAGFLDAEALREVLASVR